MQNPDGTWGEVPVGVWRDQSRTIVRNLTEGRSHESLNWRATDRFDIEASPDYASNNGQISNIVQVNRGKANLKDAQGFGNMWKQKMSGGQMEGGQYHQHQPPLENVAQAQKAIGALNGARKGLASQGYNVGKLNPEMQKGMRIVSNADVTATGNFNKVNQQLQREGFKGGFDEFSDKLASNIEALKIAGRSGN